MQPLHFRGEQIPIGERGTGSSVLFVEEVHLKGELSFSYDCNLKTIPLGVLFFNGLRLLSIRTSKTLDDFLLLLPVPTWCLRCPTNSILASNERGGRVPEEVPG